MTPTYEEMLKGNTQWNFMHKGVDYLLSHHGYIKDDKNPYDKFSNHPGIWCYYLLIPENMFSHRWQEFVDSVIKGNFSDGPFTHDMFDTEITYNRIVTETHYSTNQPIQHAKVGCDYNHLWHSERGYPDRFETVKIYAIKTVDKFLSVNTDYRVRCRYSGIWDIAENFYESKAGMVHISKEKEIPEEWIGWKRIEK